jgi:hypothetical protein
MARQEDGLVISELSVSGLGNRVVSALCGPPYLIEITMLNEMEFHCRFGSTIAGARRGGQERRKEMIGSKLEKRITPRYPVGPDAFAVYGEGSFPIRDLSLGGAFIKDADPLPAGSTMYLNLHFDKQRFAIQARVRRSLPGRGMGIQFQGNAADTREALEKYLNKLAQTQHHTPAQLAADAAPSATAAPYSETHTRSTPTAAATSSEETDVSSRLKKLTEGLRDLEEDLGQGDFDVRVLSDFRAAVDHIRLTAWAVQEWAELEGKREDPYSILPLLTRERVRRASSMSHELATDLAATELSQDTEGLDELFRAVEELHDRLARLFKKSV